MDEREKSFLFGIAVIVLAIIGIIIYSVVTAKSNFECQRRLSDGTCVSANCPPDESWSFHEQKCVPRPSIESMMRWGCPEGQVRSPITRECGIPKLPYKNCGINKLYDPVTGNCSDLPRAGSW